MRQFKARSDKSDVLVNTGFYIRQFIKQGVPGFIISSVFSDPLLTPGVIRMLTPPKQQVNDEHKEGGGAVRR